MNFQVLRVEKIKSPARLSGRVAHAMRSHVPNNADPAMLGKNHYGMPGVAVGAMDSWEPQKRTDAVLERWRASLPPKYRKDAVIALELLVGASKESFEKMGAVKEKKFFEDAILWVSERFGGWGNVSGISIHRDETTPHMSVFITPVVRSERGVSLSAKNYIDGPKALSDMQTDFHKKVSLQYGLERGRFKSPAIHTSVKEFYALGAELSRQKKLEQEAMVLEIREKNKRKIEKDDLER